MTISVHGLASKKARSVNSAWADADRFRLMTIFLFLAALTAGPVSPPAPADDQTGRTAIVGFHDLDLSTSAGRAALDRRVKRAVKHVCEVAGPNSPTDFDRIGACREQALKDATRQIELAAAPSADGWELASR